LQLLRGALRRGHIRSANLKDVISQAELFVANGYREIVLVESILRFTGWQKRSG
jgi:tRNA A37 methylthiotransferase MiaB